MNILPGNLNVFSSESGDIHDDHVLFAFIDVRVGQERVRPCHAESRVIIEILDVFDVFFSVRYRFFHFDISLQLIFL